MTSVLLLHCKNQRMVSNQLELTQLQFTKQCVRKQVDHFTTLFLQFQKKGKIHWDN